MLPAVGSLGLGTIISSSSARASVHRQPVASRALGSDADSEVKIVDLVLELPSVSGNSKFQPRCAVLGYHEVGDGGGGLFYWDDESTEVADNGLIVQPEGHIGSGRWYRLHDYISLSVRWFGARGDNGSDDTIAVQSAIQAAVRTGIPKVMFPEGVYRVSRTISLVDDGSRTSRGLCLQGVSQGASTRDKATSAIRWHGDSSDASIIEVLNRDCVLENLDVYCGYGKQAKAGVTIARSGEPGSVNSTNIALRRVRIQSGAGVGELDYCVLLAPGDDANTEFNLFEDCYFYGARHALVYINNSSGQCKHNSFVRTAFCAAPFGIRTDRGSFQCYSSVFSHTDVGIYLGAPTDNIYIVDVDSEGCHRFLDMTRTNSPVRWPIAIEGGRFALSKLHPDGEYVRYSVGGTLRITGALFEGSEPGSSSERFRIVARNAFPAASLTVEDSVLPNTNPFSVQRSDDDPVHARFYCRLRSFGNTAPLGEAETQVLPDTMGVLKTALAGDVGPKQQALSIGGVAFHSGVLSGVAGISATEQKTHNLRGTVVFESSESSAQVVFPREESDASYVVAATVIDESGNPDPASRRPRVANRGVDGFEILLECPPGPSSTVTVGWILVG